MQAHAPQHGLLAAGERVAEILAGVGVEQALLRLAVALHVDVDDGGPARDGWLDVRDLVSGYSRSTIGRSSSIESGRAAWSTTGNRRPEPRHQLTPVDQRAARRAQHDDVEAEGEAGPEMDLEDRSPEPHPLRLLQPPFPHAHRRKRLRALALRCQMRWGGVGTASTAAHASATQTRIIVPLPWPYSSALDLVLTKSSLRLARAAWARCIARRTRT